MSSIETIRFWEEPLQFDPHASMASDLNLAPSDQITLREINEPPMDDVDMIVEKVCDLMGRLFCSFNKNTCKNDSFSFVHS